MGNKKQPSGTKSHLSPPPLRDDCFAMPQGAHWTSEVDALAQLRDGLHGIVESEEISVSTASGRFLAEDVLAKRAHPPVPNSAVDGYALVGPIGDGLHEFDLLTGRAAAGDPFEGSIKQGQTVRTLTGAAMPSGADTVILQEDVATDGQKVAFHGPLKKGANARAAGEDMKAGQTLLRSHHRISPSDIGMMTAAGVATVKVFRVLRVGVLSTGDELKTPNDDAAPADIYDANRPMLLADLRAWGFDAIDLGCVGDNRAELRSTLDDAVQTCDAIVTSGGASAGDEDHMSALLNEAGQVTVWRIAIKPGRPLALAKWQGTPVFGLPGNPVAAQVCALVFARPALTLLGGGHFEELQGFAVPAAFTKSKKEGRVEYLRARIENGYAVVFPSEGSGRVSGLSWATGLVRLPHEAVTIDQGTLVQFLPYASFGI